MTRAAVALLSASSVSTPSLPVPPVSGDAPASRRTRRRRPRGKRAGDAAKRSDIDAVDCDMAASTSVADTSETDAGPEAQLPTPGPSPERLCVVDDKTPAKHKFVYSLDPSVPPGPSDPIVKQQIIEALHQIYEEHDPAKVRDIGDLCLKYVGQERLLYIKVCKK